MDVRLSVGSAVARNAERGATSMFWLHARRTRNVRASGRADGMGTRARQMADGRCVKTIVCCASESVVICGLAKAYLDVADAFGNG